MFKLCPKCGHSPLPADQALPASCSACGVILAKMEQLQNEDGESIGLRPQRGARGVSTPEVADDERPSLRELLFHTPAHMDPITFWPRVAMLIGFAVWGCVLIAQDYRTGELGSSFIHRPLLIFHEAGHVVFMLLGHWMMVLGGSLGQLIMPAILGGALLIKNRDPFGASIGLWLLGVSLLDLAPYMYDSLHPQLMLLSGMTGEEGGHDWIYLFSSMGLLQKSQFIGGLVHKLGALTVLVAIVWGALVLRLQFVQRDTR
ncbi:MAG: zinc ribbon domain-containing protein [Pseudomonadota bacterium]